MLDKQEKTARNKMLALSGGLLVATLVFILFYQLFGLLTHDKPLAFIFGLILSVSSLFFVRNELVNILNE
ncbi:MAG: hypothetical protein SFY67_03665 [Candidatus Melainabacteria bacterium]|nr:hypothetical protein [Candidatus Melainabacteria bacterium]